MRCVGGGAGKPLLPTLDKSFGAQDISGIRAAFSLDTFFSTAWMQEVGQRMEQLPRRSKRKYLAFGCENPIKSSFATATPYLRDHFQN